MAFEIGKFWAGKNGKLKLLAVVLIIAVFVLFVIFVNDETTSTVSKSKDSNVNKTKDQAGVISVFPINTTNLNIKNSRITPTEVPPQIANEGCGVSGAPIIDITQKVINDHDFDANGDDWAIDNYDQHIKVWKRPENSYTYCAEQNLVGFFDAIAGRTSPGSKAGVLVGNEDGTLTGNSRIMIVGLLKSNPGVPLIGTIPTADYQCLYDENCPEDNSHFWSDIYFDHVAYGYPTSDWFVWTYKNGDHMWINSNKVNYGDIL